MRYVKTTRRTFDYTDQKDPYLAAILDEQGFQGATLLAIAFKLDEISKKIDMPNNELKIDDDISGSSILGPAHVRAGDK